MSVAGASAPDGNSSGAATAGRLGLVGGQLGRFDLDRLTPLGPTVEVGEPHAAGSLSASGKLLAFGLSKNPEPTVPFTGRVGLAIADASSLKIRHEVQTGIAASQVGFPGPVAALLQNGHLVIVDPDSGEITRRIPDAFDSSSCTPERRPLTIGNSVVFVAAGNDGAARLAVVNARGTVRTRRLGGLRVRRTSNGCGVLGAAADRRGRRLFVTSGSRVATINFPALKVRYHAVRGLRFRCAAGHRCVEWTSASWVPRSGLVIAAETIDGPSGGIRRAGGVVMFGSSLRQKRWSDTVGKRVAPMGGGFLVLGDGLRRFSHRGRLQYTALRRSEVFSATVVRGRVFARTGNGLVVLDATSGAVRSRHRDLVSSMWFV